MSTRTKYIVAWTSWIVAGLVVEALALTDDEPGATASAHIRTLTRTKSGKMVVGTALGWLAVHLLVPPRRLWKGFAVPTPTEVPPGPR